MVFENYPLEKSQPDRSQRFLKIRALRGFERTNYPLTLVVNPTADYFSRLIYDTSRFDEATIRRMMGHFQTLLEEMVAKKGGRLAEFSMLTAAERHQLLVERNETQTEYPKEKCIHQLFEQQDGTVVLSSSLDHTDSVNDGQMAGDVSTGVSQS